MKAETCPVCGWEIQDGGVKVTAGGKEVTVCCQECADKLTTTPATDRGPSK